VNLSGRILRRKKHECQSWKGHPNPSDGVYSLGSVDRDVSEASTARQNVARGFAPQRCSA